MTGHEHQNTKEQDSQLATLRAEFGEFPPGHPERARACLGAASLLRKHYVRIGDKQLLFEAVDLEREALGLCPPGHEDHATACVNVAASLYQCYKRTGDRELLSEAVERGRQALSLYPQEHENHAFSCQNLAIILYGHHESTGDPRFLIESVHLARSALARCPPDHKEHARSCRTLAASLLLRFDHTSDQELLIECISLGRDALARCPPGHPDHASSCGHLASALYKRYDHTGDEQLLLACIDLKRSAFALCPPEHPDRATSCQSLATSLFHCYEDTHDQRLLIECIDLERSALALCPPGHTDDSLASRNLAVSLHHRYKNIGDPRLLEEAILLYQDSLVYCAPGAQWRHSLGLAQIYLERGSSVFNLNTSIEHLMAGLQDPVHDSIPILLHDALVCLNQLWQCNRVDQMPYTSLNRIYERLMMFLPPLAHPVFDPSAQLTALRNCCGIGADAFIDAALSGNSASGLEMLESVQGLVWSQRLHHRQPGLEHVPDHLANDLKTWLRILNDQGNCSVSGIKHSTVVSRDVRHEASVRVQALVRQIRALPGLERFMLGDAYDSLRMAACQYPVVILVSARGYSYALVMGPSLEEPTLLPLELNRDNLLSLSPLNVIGRAHRSATILEESSPLTNTSEGRGLRKKTAMLPYLRQLSLIWVKVVKPVLQVLGFQRCTDGGSRPRLYWCPTGPFSALPLHAAGIYEGTPSQTCSCSDYVVSSYIPTVTTLRRLQKASTPSLSPGTASLALVAEERAFDSSLPTIRGVLQESINVASVARSATLQHVQQQTGSTSVSNVVSALKTANIVHLACHGTQDATDATQSGFCLGDGRLTIEKLMDIKLENAFLAYLSACQTAAGDTGQPDQVMHLAAAMLNSGFKSVVATMWAIDDDDASWVATWFYEDLFSNESIDADSVPKALDVAVAKLRASGVPLERWAPFIHMGL